MTERGRDDIGRPTALVVTTSAGLESEARQELRRLLPDARVRPLVLKGNLLLATDVSEEEALMRIAAGETRCVSRAVAVQRQVAVTTEPGSFSEIAAAIADIGRLGAGETFVIRCRRRGTHEWSSRELERAVAREVESRTGAVGEYEGDTDWHVTVQVYQDIAYVGISSPQALVHKELLKQRKYPPGARPLNRAQWKIREALAAFAVELAPAARVLDLGSAPGGWAAVLADLGAQVTAVDPADLEPEVVQRPGVEHLRCRAEELAERGDLFACFDLITCDMNVDPAEAAGIMSQLARVLKPGAPAIMTVKYPTRRRRWHEREARAALSAEYEGIQVRRLPHNARETTAFMRRRAGGAPRT